MERVYSLFKNRLSLEDFKAKLNSLPNEKKVNFIGACLQFQQALKCKKCEPNGPNIAMMLLCVCADAIKITGKKGPHENFIRLYQTYCPSELREDIPVECYNLWGEPQLSKASFEETLHLIYECFRNPFVHEAKKWFEQFSPEDYGSLQKWAKLGVQINVSNTRVEVFSKDSKVRLYYGDKGYHINTINKFLKWFENITLESLYNFLKANAQQRDS